MENNAIKSIDKVNNTWIKTIEEVDIFVSKNSLSKLNDCYVLDPAEKALSVFPIELFCLKRLAYNPKEGIVDKLVNVYAAMNSIGATVFIIIHGEKDGNTSFYIGCLSRNNIDEAHVLLKSSFEGNFPGIEFESCSRKQKNDILDTYFPLEYKQKSIASVSVSADFRKEKTEDKIAYIQGIEKFIETMKGQEYTAMFLAEPIRDC